MMTHAKLEEGLKKTAFRLTTFHNFLRENQSPCIDED